MKTHAVCPRHGAVLSRFVSSGRCVLGDCYEPVEPVEIATVDRAPELRPMPGWRQVTDRTVATALRPFMGGI